MRDQRRLDSILQTTVDRRDLAVIANYLNEKGYTKLNKSELVRIAIEAFANVLIANGHKDYETTGEANAVLKELGIYDLNPSGRLEKNLVANLILDEREERRKSISSKIQEAGTYDSTQKAIINNFNKLMHIGNSNEKEES